MLFKKIFKKNSFPVKLLDSCIKNFLNKRLTEKLVILTAEKKDLVIVLPFLSELSLDLRTRLKNSISKDLPFCKSRVIFKSAICITNFLKFKDKLLYCLCPNVLYKFPCVRWNTTYYGETCRHLRVGVDENSGVPPLTGKKSKSRKSAAVKDHMLFVIILSSLMTLKFWEPVTQISTLISKKLFQYYVMNPSQTKMTGHYLFTYLIDPSAIKLYFKDIYYCYSCCINTLIVS